LSNLKQIINNNQKKQQRSLTQLLGLLLNSQS